MLCVVKSAAIVGLEAYQVEIEVDISKGLPGFTIVGLPDAAVQESRERVRAAIKNSEFEFKANRVTVNLAPADMRKEGPSFDLPIAIGLLVSAGQLKLDAGIDQYWLVGELSLTGDVKPIKGALSIAIGAAERGIKGLIASPENAREAAIIDNLNVVPVKNLSEAAQFLSGEKHIEFQQKDEVSAVQRVNENDYSDIKGQFQARRAIEIAAAGGHNMLMVGPPGSGKTMLASGLPTILPALSPEEAIDVTKIYSIYGNDREKRGLIWKRPFRSPHHTISFTGLVGGGQKLRPGEITLSHHGVLFLDELPQFGPSILQTLRQPIEAKEITIARASGNLTYPASFMLVCAMNPCPCGYLGDAKKECTCSLGKIQRYRNRVSGPLLDRIDMQVEVARLTKSDLMQCKPGEKSEAIRGRVDRAREIQRQRFSGDNVLNSQMSASQVRTFCQISNESKTWLDRALDKLLPTARGYDRLLKTSRTIADLSGNEKIELEDLAEAIQYRSAGGEIL